MTLLITAACPEYCLSCSDTRISVQAGSGFVPVDENFNKHIFFRSGGFGANISYTGVARWQEKGKTVCLYDLISESLAKSAKASKAFGPLSYALATDLVSALRKMGVRHGLGREIIELHLVGYHELIPWPLIGVISTFRKTPPWKSSYFEWVYHLDGVHYYFKAAKEREIVIGGFDTAVRKEEKEQILTAFQSGGNAYEISCLAKKIIENAATRSKAIGSRSVSVLIPQEGFLDTNLWQQQKDQIIAFLPRMVFPNGTMWGPSEFPVDLRLILNGKLPIQSIFWKSIIAANFKRSVKRRMFRSKRGDFVPGIIGLLGLALYGNIPAGYEDFGLKHDR
jgi:hypothetical protein